MERLLSELDHYQSGRELKKKENLHVVLWLVKDFAWLMHFKVLGLIMAVPTVILAVVLTVNSLMSVFDTYYKWLFFQLRYVMKLGNSPLMDIKSVNAQLGNDIDDSGLSAEFVESSVAELDEFDVSNYNFKEIFDFAESKGLLNKSKHKILKFLGYGDLGVANFAGLKTTVLNDVLSDYYHNLAVTCWIVGNVIWMVGEFFFDDAIRYVSVPFFVVGLLVVAFYHLYLKAKIKTKDPKLESSVKQ